jgi:hypothetical protein
MNVKDYKPAVLDSETDALHSINDGILNRREALDKKSKELSEMTKKNQEVIKKMHDDLAITRANMIDNMKLREAKSVEQGMENTMTKEKWKTLVNKELTTEEENAIKYAQKTHKTEEDLLRDDISKLNNEIPYLENILDIEKRRYSRNDT